MKKASIPDILGCCVSYLTTYFKEDAMNAFIEKHQKNIRRLPRTRRYRLRPKGAKILATILLTQQATTEQLNRAAA